MCRRKSNLRGFVFFKALDPVPLLLALAVVLCGVQGWELWLCKKLKELCVLGDHLAFGSPLVSNSNGQSRTLMYKEGSLGWGEVGL